MAKPAAILESNRGGLAFLITIKQQVPGSFGGGRCDDLGGCKNVEAKNGSSGLRRSFGVSWVFGRLWEGLFVI